MLGRELKQHFEDLENAPNSKFRRIGKIKREFKYEKQNKAYRLRFKRGTPLSHFNIELLTTGMFDIVYCLALNPIRLSICGRDDSTRHSK